MIPQNVRNRVITWPSHSTPRYLSKITENTCPHKNLFTNIHSSIVYNSSIINEGFSNGSAGEEFTCNAGDTGDTGFIPGLGGCPGGGNPTHSRILARKIPLTEEPGMLQSIGPQNVRHSWSEWAHYKCLSINEWATKCIPKEWNTIQP